MTETKKRKKMEKDEVIPKENNNEEVDLNNYNNFNKYIKTNPKENSLLGNTTPQFPSRKIPCSYSIDQNADFKVKKYCKILGINASHFINNYIIHLAMRLENIVGELGQKGNCTLFSKDEEIKLIDEAITSAGSPIYARTTQPMKPTEEEWKMLSFFKAVENNIDRLIDDPIRMAKIVKAVIKYGEEGYEFLNTKLGFSKEKIKTYLDNEKSPQYT